jgi:hypothetical protein
VLRTESIEDDIDGAEGRTFVAKILSQELAGRMILVALVEKEAVGTIRAVEHFPPLSIIMSAS